jgi:hypothetical protein
MLHASAPAHQDPPFAPGEVLVRFAPGTPGSEAAAQAARSDPPTYGAFQPVTDRLHDDLGVPLNAVRLSAGGWVVLAVNGDALGQRLAARAAARANVVGAEVAPAEPPRPAGGVSAPGIRVRFRSGTAEAQAVAARLADARDERLAAVVGSLETDLGVSFTAEAAAPETLVLKVDLRALTLNLVERIKQLPGVEAAQPNYVLRRFRDAP